MSNQELDPRLRKKLESLENVPDRRLQRSLSGREDFLAFAKTRKPYQPPVENKRKSGSKSSKRKWLPRLVALLAALLLASFSIGGTVYASQASLPDDLLYPVKILLEDIQVELETDPEDRLDLYVSFASRRMQEIQAQVEAGEEVSDKALRLLEKHTQQMLQEASQLGEHGLNNALRQIEENLQKQNQMMEKLQSGHPQDGSPGLINAQERIQQRMELIENGIKEPQEFKKNLDQPGKGNGKPDSSGKSDDAPGQEKKEEKPDKGNGGGSGKK
jgi:hypothetical protein